MKTDKKLKAAEWLIKAWLEKEDAEGRLEQARSDYSYSVDGLRDAAEQAVRREVAGNFMFGGERYEIKRGAVRRIEAGEAKP